jgi:hypothetical protein
VSGGGGKVLPINVTPTVISNGAPKDMVLSGAAYNDYWNYCETNDDGTIKKGSVGSVTASGQITISFELQKKQ